MWISNPQPRQVSTAKGLTPARPRRRRRRAILRAVETFDGSFTLDTSSQEVLDALLRSKGFRAQVAEQRGLAEGQAAEFTGMLFQPVPWSPTTKRGMPAEFEKVRRIGGAGLPFGAPPAFAHFCAGAQWRQARQRLQLAPPAPRRLPGVWGGGFQNTGQGS